jgi:hypothetical protein
MATQIRDRSSLTVAETSTPSPLWRNIEDVTEMLKKSSWTYFPPEEDTARAFVRADIRTGNYTYRIVLRASEKRAKVNILCDQRILESARTNVISYLKQINRTLHGTLELNDASGELRYRNSMHNSVVSRSSIQTLIAASLLTFDQQHAEIASRCREFIDLIVSAPG